MKALPLPAVHCVDRIARWATLNSVHIRHGSRATTQRCGYKKEWTPEPDVDTRIHWSSPDEGWIGGSDDSSSASSSSSSFGAKGSSSVLDGIFNDLAYLATDSHYQFLGVPPDADTESIKAAYRKLSKQYHPDTTSLPLEIAAKKFLRLQTAYDVLSSVEERRIYDWNLAKEVSRQQGGGFVWPYEADKTQKRSGPQIRYATKQQENNGEYLEFTGQMIAALYFEAFALFISVIIIIYVAFFKH